MATRKFKITNVMCIILPFVNEVLERKPDFYLPNTWGIPVLYFGPSYKDCSLPFLPASLIQIPTEMAPPPYGTELLATNLSCMILPYFLH